MDRYFHYYATYLAARWAGMESDKAQQLAYCCQTMDELNAGSSMAQPWHYQVERQGKNQFKGQGDKFYPCITGVNTKAREGFEDESSAVNSYLDNIWLYSQHEHKSHQESSGFGTLNAELAFRCFPALSTQAATRNHVGAVNGSVSSVLRNSVANITSSATTDDIKPGVFTPHNRHKRGFTTQASCSGASDNWQQEQRPLTTLAARQSLSHGITSRHYNPLTDIDWQRGGNFKQGFSQKLASKHQASLKGSQPNYQVNDGIAELSTFDRKTIDNEKSSQLTEHEGNDLFGTDVTEIDVPGIEATDVDVIDIDEVFFNAASPQSLYSNSNGNSNYEPLLVCVANSAFSREMLNDIIFKSRYRSEVKDIELPLLACRLFVYQQTWRHNLENSNKAKQLKDAFYWTLYAIECFLCATPLKNKRHWFAEPSLEHTAKVDEQLSELFSFSGEPFEQEAHWLTYLPRLLACQQQGLPVTADNWQQGLRYRKNHLLEQAMLAAKTARSREIKDLTGFKKSDFFKLNKAAEYHANWLTCQLKHKQVFNIDTSQSLGSTAVWQL